MKEKIMILGAGRGQVDLIQTAKRMGYETVVASIKGDYPGFKIFAQIDYVMGYFQFVSYCSGFFCNL